MMDSNLSSIKPSPENNTQVKPSKLWPWSVMAVSLVGIGDTLYLILNEIYGGTIKCIIVNGCEKVLTSKYSVFAGIHLSWWGLGFYASVFLAVNIYDLYGGNIWLKLLSLMTTAAFLVSLSLLGIQIFILKALCIYCLTSAASSTTLFVLVMIMRKKLNIPRE